ncbi:MAG TPA: hypothetical protein VLT33_39900 [Labilithrix sp.]|nr:hypothetical protein [Labilithrix sp.]
MAEIETDKRPEADVAKQPSAPPAADEAARPASFPPAASVSSLATATGASGGPLAAYEAVSRSARLPDLVAVTQKIVTEAAAARRSGWNHVEKVGVAADEAKLSRADAETPFGNALKVLGSGPEGEAERALAAALWAHAIAEDRRDDEERLAGDVLWLATHTAFDATPLLDRALGEEADDLWVSIGARVRRVDEGRGTSLGRGEAIIGCAALASSDSTKARQVARDLAPKLKDPTLARLLAGASVAPAREVRLEGEAMSAPRGPIVTTLLALTGLLFVIHAVRIVARLALAYRRPAEVSLSEAGIRMKTRTELLGRTLREREHVIVRSGLVRVVREVRYPRAAFYAGLLALALGSYVGVRALADGVRAASPSLLLTGLVIVILGIAVDFVLGSIIPGNRGRVRISFIPRTGAVLCLADVDAARADDALTRALTPPR